ncbi:MAG TPA: metalloregulator ArsR/SmtB family transcription factor [Acidimicrobiales bacterium]|nr:metalloregulator ArsR/SmtB family transcription factor [Acidimicrobiales bacterium]
MAPTDAEMSCCPPLGAGALDADEAAELARVLKALADPIRLRVVSLIASSPSEEVCACDFPELLDRTQSTMSHHLGQLVDAGLLTREQRGKWAWFKLNETQLDSVRSALTT